MAVLVQLIKLTSAESRRRLRMLHKMRVKMKTWRGAHAFIWLKWNGKKKPTAEKKDRTKELVNCFQRCKRSSFLCCAHRGDMDSLPFCSFFSLRFNEHWSTISSETNRNSNSIKLSISLILNGNLHKVFSLHLALPLLFGLRKKRVRFFFALHCDAEWRYDQTTSFNGLLTVFFCVVRSLLVWGARFRPFAGLYTALFVVVRLILAFILWFVIVCVRWMRIWMPLSSRFNRRI